MSKDKLSDLIPDPGCKKSKEEPEKPHKIQYVNKMQKVTITPENILKKYWGYTAFRPLQEAIIHNILKNRNTLALLPTGGGKSVCFQVPGLILEGVTIVITPLIALMKDQVKQLTTRGIRAASIHTGMHHADIDRILDNFVLGDYRFLYISPERLQSELFQERVKRMNIKLLVIDEAHCISKWGHDFRPSYLKINEFRELISDVPVIALTATATPETKEDIIKQLNLKQVDIFQHSFKRENLSIYCVSSDHKTKSLAELLQKRKGTSTIIYVKTRKETQEISDFLNRSGFPADYYHAGLSTELRAQKQDQWINNEIPVIVCTNAFGMGIDKPDVRLVVHLHIVSNMEAYYQEIGRAGRDGLPAESVLFYNLQDEELLKKQLEQTYPPIEELQNLYQSLANYFKAGIGTASSEFLDFDVYHFNSTFGKQAISTHYALKLLESQGLIGLNDAYQNPSTLQFLVNNSQLYQLQIKHDWLDLFAKTLLRIYGGELFSNPVMISETEISRTHKVPVSQVEKWLKKMEQMTICSYRKHSGKPGISFLGYRFDAAKLPLNIQEIKGKKQREKLAIDSMIDFVKSRKKCRMAQLQEFFGETNPERCGQCDHCTRQKKKEIKQHELEAEGQLLAALFPISLQSLETAYNGNYPLEEIVHYHVDTGKWLLQEHILTIP
jgi:ATP-dependent DNA helicase RecQ